MKRFLSVLLVLGMVLALTACSGNTAKEPQTDSPATETAYEEPEFVLKAGHVEATDGVYHYMFVQFADMVKERTNGRVQIDIYPQSQLGSEVELAEGLRIGTIDFCLGSVGNLTPIIPEGGLLGVPYILESTDHLNRVIDPEGEFFAALKQRITDKDLGLVLLGIPTNGIRSIYNNVRPINTPEDLKGIKLRTMTSDIQVRSFEAMGASPSAVAFNELYSAMQHGVVDGAENSPVLIWTMKHYECAKYLSLTEHMIATGLFLMSERTVEKLPADVVDIIYEAAYEAVDAELIFDITASEEALENLKEWGVEVNEVDKDPFIQRTAHLHQEVAEKYNCTDLLDIIKKEAQ